MSNKEFIKKFKNKDITFKNGIPTALNVSADMRLSTEPYENIKINAGISISLKEGADIEEAYGEAWDYVLGQIVDKASEIKKIYDTEKMD